MFIEYVERSLKMSQTNYTANDIQTLDFRTAIRTRIFTLKF